MGGEHKPFVSYRTQAKKEIKGLKPWCRDETLEKIKAFEARTKNCKRISPDDFTELRNLIIEESEWAFEKSVIEAFPHCVVCPVPPYNEIWYKKDNSLRYIDDQMDWLKANFPATVYNAFPVSASGKYKFCCYNVYFKNANDAMLFKLSRI
jgi:hypothetical protein